MDWTPLIATLGGAFIAFAGTVLADVLRHRGERSRSGEERSRELYAEFILAVGACHARLRELASPGPAEAAPVRAAFAEAGVYEARERLYIDGAPAVTAAAQEIFRRLRELRDAVAAGAAFDSRPFHDAYHPYLEAVWHYRAEVRRELGARPLTLEEFGWEGWSDRATCPVCGPA
ncbi:CchlQ [Streptomyces sp. DSM 44917]|uniref:CchlQ n=1 Tax=Streptomyces boetiae TaxID=3075541 RepID=A0ABU2L4I7_9ACTN|nr:CchlQ [Streptomyces sp. DSM 44917]MDT0306432.1 CchlQ [Streptomyces sp. DSM 44917]